MTPGAKFDDIIHPSTRLSIVALLAATDWVDFGFVRDRLGLSDSALSKQFSTLEDAGYISLERLATGRRRTVRVRLTTAGRDAFNGHVAALRSIVGQSTSSTRSSARTKLRVADLAAGVVGLDLIEPDDQSEFTDRASAVAARTYGVLEVVDGRVRRRRIVPITG